MHGQYYIGLMLECKSILYIWNLILLNFNLTYDNNLIGRNCKKNNSWTNPFPSSEEPLWALIYMQTYIYSILLITWNHQYYYYFMKLSSNNIIPNDRVWGLFWAVINGLVVIISFCAVFFPSMHWQYIRVSTSEWREISVYQCFVCLIKGAWNILTILKS